MSKSTPRKSSSKPSKPAKPYRDFPLFPHATRRWAKKIKGRLHYFGPWNDPDAALQRYLDQKDDLYAGRRPRSGEGLTVADLANRYLTWKRHLTDNGEMKPQSFTENYRACQLVVDVFGKNRLVSDLRPSDFEGLAYRFPKAWGPHYRAKMTQLVRSLFKYGWEQDLIERPVKLGQFRRPAKKVFRLHRAAKAAATGKRLFAAGDLRKLLDEAGQPLRAMLLLGINAALGNMDMSRLPLNALDLEAGWLDYPRPKTGMCRRAKLWPETLLALQEAMAARPMPRNEEHGGRVFLTAKGNEWVKVTMHEDERPDGTKVPVTVNDDAIAKEFAKLSKRLKLKRPGLGVYALRHTFQTVAEERAGDAAAIRIVMGHADNANDMSSHYREEVGDGRLVKVAAAVRDWLFSSKELHDL